MCLIVHKPAGQTLPRELLHSAARYNPHGVGFIALPVDSRAAIYRRVDTDIDEVLGWAAAHADDECVFHFRYRTRGAVDLTNTHPLPVTPHIHVFHNGTLAVDSHTPERSDTWHLASDFLTPVLMQRPALIANEAFQRMLKAAIGRLNRLVLVDTAVRRVVIVNREAGIEHEGFWLSNSRWFDPRVLGRTPRLSGPRPRVTQQVRFFA